MKYRIIVLSLLALACSGTGKESLNNGQADTYSADVANEGDSGETADTSLGPQDVAPIDTNVPPTDVTSPDLPPTDIEIPQGCCLTDGDCPPAFVCAGVENGAPGRCVDPPEEWFCWDDDDCELPDTCHFPATCGCMDDCEYQPGQCMHPIEPPNCCQDSDECMGMECIGADVGPGAGGTCLSTPDAGKCYYNHHCAPGHYCIYSSICSCDMNCISELGDCIPYDVNCCFGDDDCEPGQLCSPTFDGTDMGVCKDQPPAGLCWTDKHCKPDEVCEGSSICPCDADCDGVDMPGVCTMPCDDDDCCCSDADCGEAMVCAHHPAGNVCLPDNPAPMCWDDGDCGEGGYCQGANVCACNWDCDADGADIPGTCMSGNGDVCCMTDADCPQFFMGEPMFCFIQEGNPFVVGTCQPMAPPGKCWSDDDCYMVQTCQGEGFCPCGMDCEAPGTTMGDCTPLPQGCCYFDSDCGDGFVCRGNFYGDNMPGSCVPDPNGPQCMGDAQCCWDNNDCNGGTCNGATVCGCIELCPVCGACQPDQMGFCG